MNRRNTTRLVAMLTGGAVLFGLQQGLGLQFYIALPTAVLAYLVMLVVVGLWLGTDTPAK
jgi:hypothetical protein